MACTRLLLLFLTLLPLSWAKAPTDVTIVVNGSTITAKTNHNFICATLDWWPDSKCNYDHCPWGNSSVTNLDLSLPILAKAIKAFNPLRIRVGGSLQDQVLYDVGNLMFPCHPFQRMQGGLFGFSKGCLRMNRWDNLNNLFRQSRAIVTFGLNALHGRHKVKDNRWEGPWNHSNVYDFIKYTVSKGHVINSWEFGNELCGSGVGASVDAVQYGKDLIKLKAIMKELYKTSNLKYSLVAPGGFFDGQWFAKFLQVSGPNTVDAVSHHIYNLGPGDDEGLVSKILNPYYLNKISRTFENLHLTIQKNGPWASAWVSESGGAYNSGGRQVSNAFVNSFWYMDQLGMASKYHTKVYCRQTLIGGNYGLLNTTTHLPNPDYYSALLWHRLMGSQVLAVDGRVAPFLRAYAHCSKGRRGVTLLLINLSKETDFQITARNSKNINLYTQGASNRSKSSLIHGLKRAVSWVGKNASAGPVLREEYHLTPKDRDLRSQVMLLNGSPLKLTEEGDIPALKPVMRGVGSPIVVASLSFAFVVLPNFDAPACV